MRLCVTYNSNQFGEKESLYQNFVFQLSFYIFNVRFFQCQNHFTLSTRIKPTKIDHCTKTQDFVRIKVFTTETHTHTLKDNVGFVL